MTAGARGEPSRPSAHSPTVEDVYEPLARYRDEFKEAFAENAREAFRELTERAGIDVGANRKIVSEIEELERRIKSKENRKNIASFCAFIFGAGAAVGGIWAFSSADGGGADGGTIAAVALCAILFAVAAGFAIRALWRLSGELRALGAEIAEKRQAAWAQMEALNRLYTWDIPPRLIEKTVPRLDFDPYFTEKRLADLSRLYGWSNDFNDDKSIVFAQSGVINGNPFVFAEYLEQTWEMKTYTGYKTISWWASETGADGKRRLVRRTQTLSASVKKPAPAYAAHKLLIYGNDAAPNLSFSRAPNELSNAQEGFLTGVRKKMALRDLKSYARNLDDESQFTLMGNHEFETLFCAKDRDNEVEFRLLFTALAQSQMLALLKDNAVGYGDDFSFFKRRKINILRSKHLSEFPIDTDPERYRHWNYDEARVAFLRFNEDYFKSVYFALAPLLSIPLYQQTRTHQEIYKGVLGEPSAFWEHEAICNHLGEENFKHPACITHNILKTRFVARRDGESELAVSAHGYRGETRTETRCVFGGDGNFHNVDVEWTEYLPVCGKGSVFVAENREPPAEVSARKSAYRRCIFSRL